MIIHKGFKPDYFRQTYDVLIECFEPEERPTLSQFKEILETNEVWVMFEYGSVIGFTVVSQQYQNPYIWIMCVYPDFRGKGYGSAMLKAVLEQYAGKTINLHCRLSNPMQKLYFDHGFRVVAVAHDHYPSEHGLLMRRRP